MYISRVKLKNWKNFKEADVNLSERVFLVGPNASGKSNFLDVFRFLRDIAKEGGGLKKAINDRGGISKIRCLASRRDPTIEIEIHLSEENQSKPKWVYKLAIRQNTRGHREPYLHNEQVRDSQGNILLDRPNEDDGKDFARLTQTHLEQINSNEKFRDIAFSLESIVYMHLVPQLLRSPELFTGPTLPGDPFGKQFLERVAKTPERTRNNRLTKISNALTIAVPMLKSLVFVLDSTGHPHLEAVYQHWRAQGAKQKEDQFSDGTLRLIGLLWILMEGASPLLLEEPELSLHAGIVKRLPSVIWQLQKHTMRQVLISTHSADLLSSHDIAPEEVFLLTPSREGTEVKRADSLRDIKALLDSGLSMGEVVIPKTAPKNINQLSLSF